MSEHTKLVQYAPFMSCVEPSFWHKLSQIKLDIDRLEEKQHHVWGSYSSAENFEGAPRIRLDCTAYNQDFEALRNLLPAHGYQLNKNTLEAFKNCDKTALLEEQGAQFWDQITSGAVLRDPSLLSRFFLLTFGDLKKYHFYYWFAFLAPSQPIVELVQDPVALCDALSFSQVKSLEKAFENVADPKQRGYFIVRLEQDLAEILPLSQLPSLFSDGQNTYGLYLSFADPCPAGKHPGWPLRTLLAVLVHYCPHMVGRDVSILSLRIRTRAHSADHSFDQSIVMTVQPQAQVESTTSWVGWERNNRGKFGPRLANVSSYMDPSKLSESAVHLNLKLMKWRISPLLDLDAIHKTRCLLMGAGTLGCTVARTLMAWGVQHITFVDNGKVSHSNPVRQSLFTFEDCLDGGQPKAETAAVALKKIYPNMESRGYTVNIPMPGHSVGESLLDETRLAVSTLEKLVDEHDVLFLLTDSRESRWLPTVLGASKGKIVLNAALGFDSYLVMRHGIRTNDDSMPDHNAPSIPGRYLGCYFCNDVTAPGNSMTDRTLDQQCTVTRPGVSSIAGALVVEILVSLLQHPLRGDAPANLGEQSSSESGVLGPVPHTIRGFLGSWEYLKPTTCRFRNCIACSKTVLDEYATRGFNFILQVLNSSSYLEDLTGLTEMHKETESTDVWALSDTEDEEEEEEEEND